MSKCQNQENMEFKSAANVIQDVSEYWEVGKQKIEIFGSCFAPYKSKCRQFYWILERERIDVSMSLELVR